MISVYLLLDLIFTFFIFSFLIFFLLLFSIENLLP